jgi:uncharacterized FAD-dependent dehydrogenase
MEKFHVGIIGGGIAGAFAALRIAQSHPELKSILFELGRPPGKRRRQLEGWFGCFPGGDGKIYLNDQDKVLNIADGRKVKSIHKWVWDCFQQVNVMKVTKDAAPSTSIQKKFKESNLEFVLNDFVQWKPDSIHQLSRVISEDIEAKGNVTFSFDNEVYKISKKKGSFIVNTSQGDFSCKKIVLCVGRSGWRWISKIYKDLGLCNNDDFAKYGIKVEISSQHLKEFNKSHCTLKNSNLELGPFNWNGTVIPEDHADLVISGFRSNEDRWKSDKVSFSLIGNRYFKNDGNYQTDRLAKLAFLLFNDRVSKERIKIFMKDKSQLSLLPEYNWLKDTLLEIEKFIPNLVSRGYFHVPCINAIGPDIKLSTNLETELEGLFVAGESTGIIGIHAAALMGGIAADGACK